MVFHELENCAMIRELHVYGEAVKVSNGDDVVNVKSKQHLGFGTRLIYAAFLIAYSDGYHKMSVIPGEGVKQYYQKKFGFEVENNYMTLNISDLLDKINNPNIYPGIDDISKDPAIKPYYKSPNISIFNQLIEDISYPYNSRLNSCNIM